MAFFQAYNSLACFIEHEMPKAFVLHYSVLMWFGVNVTYFTGVCHSNPTSWFFPKVKFVLFQSLVMWITSVALSS